MIELSNTLVAVIVAVPAATAVTLPNSSTVAYSGVTELHWTFANPPTGETAISYCSVIPEISCKEPVIDISSVNLYTVMDTVSSFVSSYVDLILTNVLPNPTASSSPCSFTVNISIFDVLKDNPSFDVTLSSKVSSSVITIDSCGVEIVIFLST